MWIVKLGGSLSGAAADGALLRAWLTTLADLGGGRVAIVAGGGGFADEARRTQTRWGVDDVAAHNMAVLAMAQQAMLLRALEPRLAPVVHEDDVRSTLRGGDAALWLPFSLLRERADEITSWDVTSDSLALRLAWRLNAERLVVVKACAVPRGLTPTQLGAAGIVDERFAAWSRDAPFAIDVVCAGEALPRLRRTLAGREMPAERAASATR